MNKCEFESINDSIFRLCIPFDEIYTTVFLLYNENGRILFDSGSNENDVIKYILPALIKKDLFPEYIICSHQHGDHSGGINLLRKQFPKAKIINFKNYESYNIIYNQFEILDLRGHTKDCIGLLDNKTKTLICGDAIQQTGVGKFKAFLEDKIDYIKTLRKIQNLKLNRLLLSHNYEPMGFIIEGDSNINKCLEICAKRIDIKINI